MKKSIFLQAWYAGVSVSSGVGTMKKFFFDGFQMLFLMLFVCCPPCWTATGNGSFIPELCAPATGSGSFIPVLCAPDAGTSNHLPVVSLDFENRVYPIGSDVRVLLSVHNTDSLALQNIKITCRPPSQLVGACKTEKIIPTLAAGKNEGVTFLYRAIEAGRGRIVFNVTSNDFIDEKSVTVSVSGGGWYGGDCHNHTDLSDGTGTVQQNADTSYAKGMSFVYITDHNDSRSFQHTENITTGSRGDFVALTGIEVDNLEGHGVCYQIPSDLPEGTYLFFTYPVYAGYFEVRPKNDAAETIRIPFRDTNLDGNYTYFAEKFGDKAYEFVWVPGHGRPQDFTGWDLTGKIALISRGTNEFVEKITNTMKAGAVAAVIYDARTGVFNMPLSEGLFGVSITKADGERLTQLTGSAGGATGTIRFNTTGLPQKPPRRGPKTWQDIIDETVADGGFFMPLHPGDPTYPFLNIYKIRNHTGVEIWNGANGLNQMNQLARKYWDDLNTRGEYHYVGVSNTDAHTASGMANTYNMCYLDSLTIPNVNHALKTGASYGSNGPQLRFDMAGITFGQTLKITGDRQTVRINIRAFDDLYPLTKVELLRFQITGKAENNKETIKSWDLTGQVVYQWAERFELEVADGEFYRVEIHSTKAAVGNVSGFACSNPVWIEKTSTATNQTGILDIKLNHRKSRLYQTDAGNYYIICENLSRLKSNQLVITTTHGAKVAKSYDATNNVFHVTITSPDDLNRRVLKIFALSK